MLFSIAPSPPNPHAPFVYANGEIRHTEDGVTLAADVWETRAGWLWAAYAVREDTGARVDAASDLHRPTEVETVFAAVKWLRSALADATKGRA